jgi:hypothetical protein
MKKIFFPLFTFILILSFQASNAQDAILNSIIKIVSPVEVSDLIKKQGIQYDRSILSNANNFLSYQTDFKKALNLGIYSTDLGYASINDQNVDALTYLNAVKKVAEGLNVGQFIDFSKITSLAMNKNNLNKLLDETSTTFENMSEHLEKQNRSNLAALILTGGWLETLYITCEVAKRQPNQELNNRIVEQKLILSQILEVLKTYNTDGSTTNLSNDLSNLYKLLDSFPMTVRKTGKTVKSTVTLASGVEIEQEEDETVMDDVKLTQNDLDRISGMVSVIRTAVVK